jgi:general secretion pathway protein E
VLESSLAITSDFRAEYLQYYGVLPIERFSDRVRVAVAGPPCPEVLEDLSNTYGVPVDLVATDPDELNAAVRRAFSAVDSVDSLVRTLDTRADADEEQPALESDARDLANQPPVIKYVNLLIREAYESRASDIHVEAIGRGVRIRFRIDGVLSPATAPPASFSDAVVSRLKLVAGLDIAQRRAPQDGRFRIRLEEQELDLRVSTVPSLMGESVVLRLLDQGAGPPGFDSLGMDEALRQAFSAVSRRSTGIILATGPTGSGKTTTLYNALRLRDAGSEKILTVEDPVEYQLPGIVQVPVNSKAGMTFATGLRSILRQDPDVVMVGEMRDQETAKIAVQAAMTGHLVFSTLHTNDAASAVTRMVDLGVEPYMIAATLQAVLAQRLVRRVCTHCAESIRPAGKLAEVLPGVSRIAQGGGCAVCRHTGYAGRIGIFELMILTDDLRDLVTGAPNLNAIRGLAQEQGMHSLREDGMRQVRRGVTTPDEVFRVVQAEPSYARSTSRGFTLVEILVVITVVSILASLVTPMVFRNVSDAKTTAARAQIEILSLALDAFRIDFDRYPVSTEGLSILRTTPEGPEAARWRGPYLRREIPLDPWGRPYIYKSPGDVNPESYDLLSLGRDGREGGEGEDMDVQSWR